MGGDDYAMLGCLVAFIAFVSCALGSAANGEGVPIEQLTPEQATLSRKVRSQL